MLQRELGIGLNSSVRKLGLHLCFSGTNCRFSCKSSDPAQPGSEWGELCHGGLIVLNASAR